MLSPVAMLPLWVLGVQPSSAIFSLLLFSLLGKAFSLVKVKVLSCSVASDSATPWKSPGKKVEWVPPLKINANGPFLFSCWYPLIRWPPPLSCLAITRNWQLPNLQCRAWNPPRSTWPIHTTSASWPRPAEAAGEACEEGGGWCSAEGQDCKSHWSLEVCESYTLDMIFQHVDFLFLS